MLIDLNLLTQCLRPPPLSLQLAQRICCTMLSPSGRIAFGCKRRLLRLVGPASSRDAASTSPPACSPPRSRWRQSLWLQVRLYPPRRADDTLTALSPSPQPKSLIARWGYCGARHRRRSCDHHRCRCCSLPHYRRAEQQGPGVCVSWPLRRSSSRPSLSLVEFCVTKWTLLETGLRRYLKRLTLESTLWSPSSLSRRHSKLQSDGRSNDFKDEYNNRPILRMPRWR